MYDEQSKSIWQATATMPRFEPLSESLKTDVCIVGGGIAGLTTAYLLAKEGKKVCVLEAFELASGQTGRTTAQFVTALDDRFFDIENYHGITGAKLAAESHSAAIELVENIVKTENIACDLEEMNGYLFAKGDPRKRVLERELAAAHRAGLDDVALVAQPPLNSFDTGPCLKFQRQMQLHPLKYLAGLAKCITRSGGRIFTGTRVMEMHGGKPAFVRTASGYKVECKSIVVATNTPVNDMLAIHTKQSAYRTYVVGFQIPKGSMDRAMYWDTLDPYHYIRVEAGGNGSHDVLVVGGEDHKTGQEDRPENRFDTLKVWTRENFSQATRVLYQWSGQVMEPVDGMAFLGHNPMDRDNVYVITGDSGNGMTHCTIGAIIIRDQIMERKNRWERLYNPSRISIRATPEFAKENANVVVQYADWLASKPKSDLTELPAGEGIVFRDGLKMVAAYKNQNGKVELMSASCTHLGGVVAWNGVERSWDCPCHGARYNPHGEVIEGPAISGLKKMNTPETADEDAAEFLPKKIVS